MATTTVDKRHVELLIHMLGAGEHINRRSRGFRNYFCAHEGTADHGAMLEMLELGVVRESHTINEDRDVIYIATLEGCQAAGLSRKATRKALGR
mgnify:CR=1 FL=1